MSGGILPRARHRRSSARRRPTAFVATLALVLGVVAAAGFTAPAANAKVVGATTTQLVASPPSSTFGQSVTFTATVTPVSPAIGVPTGNVTFKVDGVQVSTRTLSGGTASIATTSLAGGAHTISAGYSGDADFNASSASINYTVGCGTTITGAHGVVITSPGSTTCLNHATISGSVTVSSGAAIDIENSTVTGSLTAASTPGQIRICGSTFGGSVTVANAEALVVIGDPGEGCAANVIHGTLLLRNNTHGVRAVGNLVGNLVATNNSGPGAYPGDPTLISSHVPPIAVNDAYTVLLNQTLTVAAPGVLANDSAPSGGTLSSAVVTTTSHGSLTLNPNGSFTYVPSSGFFGTDSFTYRDSDGLALSNVATVNINVHAPPVAVNDSYVMVQGQTLTVAAPGVMTNDSASGGGTLVALLVTGTGHGTLTLNSDGSFSYTPTPTFSGTDTFTYRVNDGTANSNVATVTITVHTPPSVTVAKSEPSPGAGTTVTAGQATPVSYAFSVVNSGETPSGTFTLTDPVPTGTTYAPGSATCPSGLTTSSTPSCTITTGSSITWTFSSIPALTSYSGFGFHVTVDAGDANGSTISNQGSFTNVNTPGCATASCPTGLISNPVVTPTAVSVTKSEPTPGAGTTVTSGQSTPLTYDFTVANSGGTPTASFTLSDTVPAGTTYVAGSATCPSGLTTSSTPSCTITTGSSITWVFSSIPALTSYSGFGFRVSVDAGDANGSTISNAATFTNINTLGCATPICTTNTINNPVVTPAAVTVTKSEPTPGANTTVTAGQTAPITYGFSAVNSGGTGTGSFTISDPIPAGTTYVAGSATCPSGLTTSSTPSCTITTGSTITWTFSSIPALTTYSGFGFRVSVDAGDVNGSTISNAATYTNVRTPGCSTASCVTNTITNPVVTPASLTVIKAETSPGDGVTVTAGQGAPITYVLAVVNSGGTATGAVTITDPVPAGTTYVAGSAACPPATPACGVVATATTVTWTFTSVAALAIDNLTFQVSVDAGDANGSTISNGASFTNVNTPSCGTATCNTNVVSNPVVTPASVTVVKSEPTPGAGTTVTAGQATPLTYEFAVANTGGTDTGSFTITDPVPTGTTYVAGSATCPAGLTTSSTPSCTITTGSSITWTFSSIPALTSYSGFGFRVSVGAADANGSTISNGATYTNVHTPTCATPTCATNTITNPVVTPPSVTVIKSEPTPGAGTTVTAGQATPLTYRFAVSNTGGTGTGTFTISDTVPTGTTYVTASATCPAGLTTSSTPSCTITTGSTITWTFSSIPALTSYSGFGFQVTVDSGDANGSTISNNATYTNVSTPGCGAPTCATNTVANPVVTSASVTVVKSEPTPGAGVTVTSGQTTPITYQLALVNSGGTAAGAVTVSDTIPAGTTYVASSAACPPSTPACGVTTDATSITWTFTSVGALSTNNLTFQVKVDAADANGATIANQATFTNVNTPSCATATCSTNTVTNPVVNAPSVAVTKSEPTPGDGVTVEPGQVAPITYQFAVANSGGTDSGAVVLSDPVPTGTTFAGGSATCPTGLTTSSTPSCTITTGSTITWTFSSIPALTSYSGFGFQVTVDSGDANGAVISNSATYTDVNTPGCSTATCPTNIITNPVVTPASVTVTKTEPTPGADTTVVPGQSTPLSYQLAVANTGGTATGSFTISDPVPTGTTFAAGSATCPAGLTTSSTPSCTITTGSTITWTFSSIPALTSYSGFGFHVTVDAGDGDGSIISNQASFTNAGTPGCATPTCPTNTITNTVDTPPAVSSTSPASGATDVAASTSITVTFSKPVNVSGTAFTLECPTGTPEAIVVSPTTPPAASTFTLVPSASLPSFANCTVTVTATQVADSIGTTMVADYVFSFQVAATPTAIAQSFSGAIGNTTFGVGTSPAQPSTSTTGTVLTGDINGGTGTLAAVTTGNPIATAHSGSVTMNSDGTFTYQPAAGFAGPSDTFTYTVTNGLHTASNTVTITLSNKVWYVNNAGSGTGTSISPFGNLPSAQAASSAGDFIFVFGSATSYTGGIALQTNQTLVGQSVDLVVGGQTVVTHSGSNPTITNSSGSGTGIALAEGTTVKGVTVSGTSGAGILASGVNAATIDSTVTISSTGGNGLDISGGSGAFPVGAPITTSSAHSVSVQNRTGGTVTLSGAVGDTGTGILINNNTGATVNLTGGVTASTGTHNAFAATGGGTVSVTGSINTLATTTGTALTVNNTTIGAGNLSFRSISSNGAPNGIALSNTGSSGGLRVSGNGSAATGGTIQNSTGTGVSVSSSSNLNLSWMNISNNGSGDSTAGDGVKLINVFGSGQLTSSTVTGSNVENVLIQNDSGTLSSFAIQGPSCVVTNNNTTNGDTGISVLATNTSTMTVTVNNCVFNGNRTDTIHTDTADSSTLTATITNNVITAGTGGNNQGNIGIDVSSALSSTLHYDVENNKIGTDGVLAPLMNHGINVFAAGTSLATGKVVANTINMAGAGSNGTGIRLFQQDSSTLDSKVDTNTITNLGLDYGIDATDNGSGTTSSTGHLNVGVTNNNVSVLDTAIDAIHVRGRRDTTTCARITGNTATTSGGGSALQISQANTSTYDLEVSSPGALTAPQAAAAMTALNPAAVGVDAAAAVGFTGVAAGACTNIPS